MSKQYFYSYFIYKNGFKDSFGHGSVSVEDDCDTGYNDTIEDIKKKVNDGSKVIHLTAFNLIN